MYFFYFISKVSTDVSGTPKTVKSKDLIGNDEENLYDQWQMPA